MDNLIWLARRPGYPGGPVAVVRRIMRQARERVGASEEEFARLLSAPLPNRTITGAMVRAWEDRPPPPPGDVLAVAIELMGLNLVVELADAGGAIDTEMSGALALPGLDTARLQAAVNGRDVDRRIVEDLAMLTEEYWCLYHRMAPRSLQPVVGAHHELMRRLLDRRRAAPQRDQLAAALGQTAMLDGWLSFLLDDRRAARTCWTFAEELAQEFGDGPLLAHVLIARSSLASHGGRTGDSTIAIGLLDEAERVVGDTASLRAWLLARRAEEHAAVGRRSAAESRACARDLAAAERLMTGDGTTGCLPGPKTELDWNGFRGNCAVLLGRDREAVDVLRASLAEAPAARATLRAVLLNDLGAALARLGQVDEACAAFAESLALADETGAAAHGQLVASGARHLERWRGAPGVSELLDRLARRA